MPSILHRCAQSSHCSRRFSCSSAASRSFLCSPSPSRCCSGPDWRQVSPSVRGTLPGQQQDFVESVTTRRATETHKINKDIVVVVQSLRQCSDGDWSPWGKGSKLLGCKSFLSRLKFDFHLILSGLYPNDLRSVLRLYLQLKDVSPYASLQAGTVIRTRTSGSVLASLSPRYLSARSTSDTAGDRCCSKHECWKQIFPRFTFSRNCPQSLQPLQPRWETKI